MRRLICIAAAALFAPATASGATLEYSERDCYEGSHFCTTTRTYRAAPGERNQVTFAREATGTTIRDPGADVRPGVRCVAIDVHAVRCPYSDDLDLILGDGDDRAEPTGAAPHPGHVALDGGPGADTLAGAEGADVLLGGAGADTLAGGAGDDLLDGGRGRDTIAGGAGTDRVNYFEGPPVTVDLSAPGPAGPPGEPDTLEGIEDVLGSAGDDVLTGDPGRNRLMGGPGDDILSGGASGDVLAGGSGFDRLDGGPGDDDLAADALAGDEGPAFARARQPPGEIVRCGDGLDFVSEQAGDVLEACEQLELPVGYVAPRFDPRPVLGPRSVVLRLRCTILLRFRSRGCRVRVVLSAGGRRLGSRTVRFTGRGHPVRVPLRALPGRSVRVELSYLGNRADEESTVEYVIRLPVPANGGR